MKEVLQIGDWCMCKGLSHPVWIVSATKTELKGYFVEPDGTCWPVQFERNTSAKPCTPKEIQKLVDQQLKIKESTQFKRWHDQGIAFVSFEERLGALKEKQKEIEAEIAALKKVRL